MSGQRDFALAPILDGMSGWIPADIVFAGDRMAGISENRYYFRLLHVNCPESGQGGSRNRSPSSLDAGPPVVGMISAFQLSTEPVDTDFASKSALWS